MPSIPRREFLQRSSLSVAALALAMREAAAQSRMFLSLNGAVAPRPSVWPANARLAAQIGYGGIDFGLAQVKMAGLDATKALFAELKIRPTITNLPLAQPFAGDDATFQAKLPQLAEDAAFCAAIGCQRMLLVLSATTANAAPKDEYRKLVRDRLAAVSDVLVKSNIRLGLEFLGPEYFHTVMPPPPATPPAVVAPPSAAGAPASAGAGGAGQPAGGGGQGRRGGGGGGGPRVPFIWTMSETLQLAKDSGPAIGVICDVWHWYHSGSTVADILAAGNARIVQVHLSDAKAMPPADVRDNMRVMPGEGVIDFNAFFQALQKAGYDGGVSPEPLGRIPADMSNEESAKLGYDTGLAVMKKAGVL